MRYLTQRELLDVLENLGLRISVQKLIDNRKKKKIPKPDVDSPRPFPVKYYFSTVKKICYIFANRWGVPIIDEDIKKAIELVVEKRVFKF